MVEEGKHGTKSGSGYYDYELADLDDLAVQRDRRLVALGRLIDDRD